MTTDSKYNGWNNYETWCANLWLTNDEGGCDWLQETAQQCLQDAIDANESDIRAAAAESLADALESYHQEFYPDVKGVFADLLGAAFNAIDWREIAANHIGDIDLYSAGWNMPGYMPDNTPAVFMDAGDALDYIREAAEDAETWVDCDPWKADKNGEFGCTVGKYHYFVTRI